MNKSRILYSIATIFLLFVGVASASVWVGDQEIGLAEWQDSGYVAGAYIVRDPSTHQDCVYISTNLVINAIDLPAKSCIDSTGVKITIYSRLP